MRFLTFLALITLVLAGCVQPASEESGKPVIEKSGKFVIEDMTGKKIELEKRPERVVFLAGESWIYALGVKDKVVGVSRLAYTNPVLLKIDPEITEIPSPGDLDSGVNIEELLKMNPDIVIVWDECPPYKKIADRIEEYVPVFRIGWMREYPDDFCKQARLLGELFGKEDRAEKVCDYITHEWNSIMERRPAEKKRVLFSFISVTWVACTDNPYARYIEAVGGENIVNCSGVWRGVSREWIIQHNPEVWLISYYAKYNESKILKDPAFGDVEAVKNGRVYKESYKPFEYLEPYFILTLKEYANYIHPEVYSYNLAEEEEELLKEVYGVDSNSKP